MADDVIDFLRVNFAQVNARLDMIDRIERRLDLSEAAP